MRRLGRTGPHSGSTRGAGELHGGVVYAVEHGPHPARHQEGAHVPQLGQQDGRGRERPSQVMSVYLSGRKGAGSKGPAE